MKAFQKLSDAEVDRGLFNSRSARRLQVDLLKKTYCVEPDKTADYIQKMRQLKENMKPKGSQSDEYKAMRSAVEHMFRAERAAEPIRGGAFLRCISGRKPLCRSKGASCRVLPSRRRGRIIIFPSHNPARFAAI